MGVLPWDFLGVAQERPSENFELNKDSPQARNLTGWFPFNQSDTRAINFAPDPRIAELTNTSVISGIGRLGYERDFGTSANDFYYVEDGTITDLSFPVTYSAWVNPGETNFTGLICGQSQGDGSTRQSWLKVRDDSGNKASISHRNGIFYGTNGTTTLQVGTWYLITGVIASATDRRIYVNGLLENTGTDSSDAFDVPNSRNFSIGMGRDSTPSDTFSGQMAHVCVWNEAKSAEFIFNELWLKPWDLYAPTKLIVPGFVPVASPGVDTSLFLRNHIVRWRRRGNR